MSFLTDVLDWSPVRKIKADMFDTLRTTRPGAGVTILFKDLSADQKRLTQRAIIELAKEHADIIEFTDHGESVTLLRKSDSHASMIDDTHEKLVKSYGILNGDNLMKGGFADGKTLPHHELRDGVVPERYQGTPNWMSTPETLTRKQAATQGIVLPDGRPWRKPGDE